MAFGLHGMNCGQTAGMKEADAEQTDIPASRRPLLRGQPPGVAAPVAEPLQESWTLPLASLARRTYD